MTSVIRGSDNLDSKYVAKPPICRAYLSANQAISANVYVKIAFNTIDFDPDNIFNVSSNQLEPTVAGWYDVSCYIEGEYASTRLILRATKNGTDSYMMNETLLSSNGNGVSASMIMYFNGTTDWLELDTYITGTNPTIKSGIDRTNITAVLLRAN